MDNRETEFQARENYTGKKIIVKKQNKEGTVLSEALSYVQPKLYAYFQKGLKMLDDVQCLVASVKKIVAQNTI